MTDLYRNLVNYRTIFFNSRNRIEGNIYDCRVAFDSSLFRCNEDEFLELELCKFSCKQSYFNISTSRNNRFYMNDGALKIITLTPGNYNIKQLSEEIELQLNNNSTLIVWTITYDLITLTYQFSYTGTPLSTPVFSKFGTLDGLSILGFTGTTTITNGIKSTKQISIGNLDSLFICCDLASKSVQPKYSDASFRILAQIPVLCQLNGIIYWECNPSTIPRIIFEQPENCNILNLSIRDAFGNAVLLTEDYNVVFKLCIYKKYRFDFQKLESMLTFLITSNNEKILQNQKKIK